ncbi:MAG: protein translocase subunit SecD, partial [Planctomycetota bacterium]
GLDLEGGSSLRYRLPRPADLGNRSMKDVLEDTLNVFRKRIEGYGLKEIPIQGIDEDEISISLPGMSQAQVDNIVNIIQSQGQLEWMLVADDTETDENDSTVTVVLNEKRKELIEYLKKLEEEKGGWDLNVDLSSLNFEKTINGRKAYYRWMPYAEENLSRAGRAVPGPGSKLETLLPNVTAETTEGIQVFFELMKKFDDPAWQFRGQDLKAVTPSFDEARNPAVGFEFSPDRASDFGDFTAAHINKRLAIILDGKLNSAPGIRSEIPGSGIISGPQPTGFTKNEQTNLLTILRSGSLDVKPVLQSLTTIGPTLGESSIYRGKIAAGIGMGAIFLFMLIYYHFAGFIACIALSFNLVLLMGFMKFMEATLTLPGIAGIVLTVGMAVDANILIYERIREEIDKGKTLVQAIKNGFERAFITIVDANVTTFITGFFLFHFGTGAVKGFATTLMIGICTSLVSALFVSKVIFALLIEGEKLKSLSMLRALKSPNVNFLRTMRPAGICSVIIIIVGMVGFFLEDDNKYGLDFTGGYNVHLKCHQGTTEGDVRSLVGGTYPNVQVVTVTSVEGGDDAYPVFDVKIKDTLSNEEALAAEEHAGAETLDPAEAYLKKIKSLLGDKLVSDPILNTVLTPDETKGITKVQFELNLAEPTDRATLDGAFGDIIKVNSAEFGADNKSVTVNANYTQGTSITEKELIGKVNALLKGKVEVQDPFPMTGFIGPTVGHHLRDNAIKAICLSLIAIIIYIRLRFKEYKYGFAAATALVHDVLITLGAVALARVTGLVDVEIGLPLIAAFLTIIGYSLNDTIV